MRDLTGWYIERKVDGQRIKYTFPVFQLDAHKIVRIYGSSPRQTFPLINDDPDLTLIASNISDWITGQYMHTELFNCDEVSKASFEQTIIQD